MKYRYRAVERFWTSFHRLDPVQKESVRRAWKIFKEDPKDVQAIADWLQEYSEELWDAQITADAKAGKLDSLMLHVRVYSNAGLLLAKSDFI